MSEQRNVAILIFDDVEVLDFTGPFEVFNVAGELIQPAPFHTYTVAGKPGPITARGKLSINPHYTIENCPAPHILLIPGGVGTRPLLNDAVLLDWIQSQYARVELLLSVCTGALVLAQAGLLDGLSATTHHTTFDLLRRISPTTSVIENERFVANGRIITAGGITAGIDMSIAVARKLLPEDQVALILKEMEYQWHQA